MAQLFPATGFAAGVETNTLLTSETPAGDWTSKTENNGTVTIISTDKRRGTYCYRCLGTAASNYPRPLKTLAAASESERIDISFFIKVNAVPTSTFGTLQLVRMIGEAGDSKLYFMLNPRTSVGPPYWYSFGISFNAGSTIKGVAQAFATGVWHHIRVSTTGWNTTDRTATIYIDGALMWNNTAGAWFAFATEQAAQKFLTLTGPGICYSTPSGWDILIDDVRITEEAPADPAQVSWVHAIPYDTGKVRVCAAIIQTTPTSVVLDYGETESYGTTLDTPVKSTDGRYYVFDITGLAVNTPYHYRIRVTSNIEAEGEVSSGDCTFNLKSDVNTRHLWTSDTHSTQLTDKYVRWMNNVANVDLLGYLGDMFSVDDPSDFRWTTPDAGGRSHCLDFPCIVNQPLLRSALHALALGNHDLLPMEDVEEGDDGWFTAREAGSEGTARTAEGVIARTAFPGTAAERWYSFDCGYAHYAMLNHFGSYTAPELTTAQTDWLAADLAASEATWKIVAMHMYGRMGNPTPTYQMLLDRSTLWDICKEAGVNLVLFSHSHDFNRWSSQGILTVMLPGYAQGENLWINDTVEGCVPGYGTMTKSFGGLGGTATQGMYTLLDVKQDHIEITTFGQTGSLLDKFRLYQPSGGLVTARGPASTRVVASARTAASARVAATAREAAS